MREDGRAADRVVGGARVVRGRGGSEVSIDAAHDRRRRGSPRSRSTARRSPAALIRYTIVSRPPIPSSDDAMIIDVTWICRQYELSAGISAVGPT